MKKILIEVSIGELVDKISILEIKKNKIIDLDKLSFINEEYNSLYKVLSPFLKDEKIKEFYDRLIKINNKLWEVEDDIRLKEFKKEFDDEFIDLSRKVYITNDERFEIKNKINKITDSRIQEQKSYNL